MNIFHQNIFNLFFTAQNHKLRIKKVLSVLPNVPERVLYTYTINKSEGDSFGISIVGGLGTLLHGIYVKSVSPRGACGKDGSIKVGKHSGCSLYKHMLVTMVTNMICHIISSYSKCMQSRTQSECIQKHFSCYIILPTFIKSIFLQTNWWSFSIILSQATKYCHSTKIVSARQLMHARSIVSARLKLKWKWSSRGWWRVNYKKVINFIFLRYEMYLRNVI